MVSIKPEDFKLSSATISTGSAALDNQINALNQSNKAVESSLDDGAGFAGRKNSGSAFLPSAAMIGGAVAFNRDKKNIMELD
ncbi:MAG: hypothetical protein K2X66_17595, partial [Cyanobacteria bacterium]|nr:hypothetical protein [Cyanobacteriota bacterium]